MFSDWSEQRSEKVKTAKSEKMAGLSISSATQYLSRVCESETLDVEELVMIRFVVTCFVSVYGSFKIGGKIIRL